MDERRFAYDDFRTAAFFAAAEALIGSNGIEYGIAALPNDTAPDEAGSAALTLEAVGVLDPVQLLLWSEEAEEDDEWDPAYYTTLFVPFTAFPWDELTHFDDEGDAGWRGEALLAIRPGDLSMVERDWPVGFYASLRCADGALWGLDEELAQTSAPWTEYPDPCQLGYVMKKEGESLLLSAGVLVTELEAEYRPQSGQAVVFASAAYCRRLTAEQVGDLRDRFWAHLASFVGPQTTAW